MKVLFCRDSLRFYKKLMCSVILVSFISSLIVAPVSAQSLPAGIVAGLPVLSSPVTLTTGFQPPLLMGLKIHPENPLLFDFIVDQGQSQLSSEELKSETEKLVKYFLAALTIPDKEVWVNLSPYEKDRIIPDVLGQTTMGKTMLEQDYLLKQMAASLTNPETALGQQYWDQVNATQTLDARRLTLEKTINVHPPATSDQQLTTNNLNKVWIMPAKAEVLESNGIVLVGEKRLKVMLAEDVEKTLDAGRLTLNQSTLLTPSLVKEGEGGVLTTNTATNIFRQTILPAIDKAVNESQDFADVRQIYNSVILAAWYKKALKESLLGKVYADQGKVAGVETEDKAMKQRIYEQYLAAFKKGAYNLIKEEVDADGDLIPRKYFSGGISALALTVDGTSILEQRVITGREGERRLTAGTPIVIQVYTATEISEGNKIEALAAQTKSASSTVSPTKTFHGPTRVLLVGGSSHSEVTLSKDEMALAVKMGVIESETNGYATTYKITDADLVRRITNIIEIMESYSGDEELSITVHRDGIERSVSSNEVIVAILNGFQVGPASFTGRKISGQQLIKLLDNLAQQPKAQSGIVKLIATLIDPTPSQSGLGFEITPDVEFQILKRVIAANDPSIGTTILNTNQARKIVADMVIDLSSLEQVTRSSEFTNAKDTLQDWADFEAAQKALLAAATEYEQSQQAVEPSLSTAPKSREVEDKTVANLRQGTIEVENRLHENWQRLIGQQSGYERYQSQYSRYKSVMESFQQNSRASGRDLVEALVYFTQFNDGKVATQDDLIELFHSALLLSNGIYNYLEGYRETYPFKYGDKWDLINLRKQIVAVLTAFDKSSLGTNYRDDKNLFVLAAQKVKRFIDVASGGQEIAIEVPQSASSALDSLNRAIADKHLFRVNGSNNIKSGDIDDKNQYEARLYHDSSNNDFTVFKLFSRETTLIGFVILEGNFVTASSEELMAKYQQSQAVASSAIDNLIEQMRLQAAKELRAANGLAADASPRAVVTKVLGDVSDSEDYDIDDMYEGLIDKASDVLLTAAFVAAQKQLDQETDNLMASGQMSRENAFAEARKQFPVAAALVDLQEERVQKMADYYVEYQGRSKEDAEREARGSFTRNQAGTVYQGNELDSLLGEYNQFGTQAQQWGQVEVRFYLNSNATGELLAVVSQGEKRAGIHLGLDGGLANTSHIVQEFINRGRDNFVDHQLLDNTFDAVVGSIKHLALWRTIGAYGNQSASSALTLTLTDAGKIFAVRDRVDLTSVQGILDEIMRLKYPTLQRDKAIVLSRVLISSQLQQNAAKFLGFEQYTPDVGENIVGAASGSWVLKDGVSFNQWSKSERFKRIASVNTLSSVTTLTLNKKGLTQVAKDKNIAAQNVQAILNRLRELQYTAKQLENQAVPIVLNSSFIEDRELQEEARFLGFNNAFVGNTKQEPHHQAWRLERRARFLDIVNIKNIIVEKPVQSASSSVQITLSDASRQKATEQGVNFNRVQEVLDKIVELGYALKNNQDRRIVISRIFYDQHQAEADFLGFVANETGDIIKASHSGKMLAGSKTFADLTTDKRFTVVSSSAAIEAEFTKGGIDFDPTNMNLQIKRDGKGVPLPLPQQNLEQINIQGLFPIIINIVPINAQTLPIFLGFTRPNSNGGQSLEAFGGQAPKEPAKEAELAAI
jgi:hypothetical protein